MSLLLRVAANRLFVGETAYRCAFGKGGFAAPGEKREGDGRTPVGRFALRECWYRPDRLAIPETGLPKRVISPSDGWCDDPANALYNQHFKIASTPSPSQGGGNIPGSFEHLWREDEAYDLIVPLGYNDGPIVPGLGSAIFLHVAKPDYTPTEGCIALARADLLAVLRRCDTQTSMEIRAE